MELKNHKGQIFTETLFLIVFFAGIFIAFQALIDMHKTRINEDKLSKEINYEFKTAIEK